MTKRYQVIGYTERAIVVRDGDESVRSLIPLPVGEYDDYESADLAAGLWLSVTPDAKSAHITPIYEADE